MNLLQLFEEDKTICLICNQRIANRRMSIKYDEIGICNICHKRLSPIANESAFEGPPNIKYLIAPYEYNNAMKDLFHRYKFKGEFKFGDLFYKMLYDYIKDIDILHDFDFIATMPLGSKRMHERGYNQADIIVNGISKKLGLPIVQCVYRSKNTKPQSSLNKEERIKNISDSFIADKRKTEGKNIILFDDVFTTGSSMNSCAGELIDKGAKSVIGISFAKTPFYYK